MICSKKQAEKALAFWKNKLNESCEDKEQVNESTYEPNTVGAVIELLKKCDPNGKLMIRMLPGNNECMLVDISRTDTDNGEITMLDIAKGRAED